MPDRNCIAFPCRTLTPIWTGDINRNSADVKESAILGSLRFWYEGLLRSKNISVCRSSGQDEECSCASCDLFGKAGQARKFRLTVHGLNQIDLFLQTSSEVAATHGPYLFGTLTGRRMGEFRPGMSFGKKCLWAPNVAQPFILEFRFRPTADFLRYSSLVALTLHEVASRGGLGARTQRGFGQIEIAPQMPLKPLLEKGRRLLDEFAKTSHQTYTNGEFTLNSSRFFSLVFEGKLPDRYRFGNVANLGIDAPPTGMPFVACAFDIRDRDVADQSFRWGGLRPALAGASPALDLGELLGSLGHASRIHVSHLYKSPDNTGLYRLKIWGDVDNQSQVVDIITEYVDRAFGWTELPPK